MDSLLNMLKFVMIYVLGLCVFLSIDALANPGIPGLRVYLSDDQGWFGWLDRLGTKGTLWDTPTVTFQGQLTNKSSGIRIETDVEWYLSAPGRLFMIRHDHQKKSPDPFRTCVYTGFTDNIPFDDGSEDSMKFDDKAFQEDNNDDLYSMTNKNIGGTYFCSDMNQFGSWFGKTRG